MSKMIPIRLTELANYNRNNQKHQYRDNGNRNQPIRSHPAHVSIGWNAMGILSPAGHPPQRLDTSIRVSLALV